MENHNQQSRFSAPGLRLSNLRIGRLFSIALLASLLSASAYAGDKTLEEQVNGTWFYTGLITGDGTSMPLTGVFLFKDGVFIEQAIFDSEPFEEASSMSHTGPTRADPATGSMHLFAKQHIGTAPAETPATNFQTNSEHDVTVTREGDVLTLIFGMGTSTVQTFKYVGPGAGELYALENGSFALVDGHFILVEGTESSVTTGYGTYTQDGEKLNLQVIRWAEGDANGAKNLKDVSLQASFDGKTLTLADGRSFKVAE